MKTGEAITRLLARYGVGHVFGIPGTHTLELYRELARGRGVTHILAHHEQGAGFMADGFARSTGRPGVCFVITGAGVTNITTPLGEAYADSVPMLVISPVNPPDGGGHNQGRLHEITDQSAVTAPLTAFSAIAWTPQEVPELIARAFAVFASERPRPVHISVPLPVLSEEIQHEWSPAALPAMPVAAQATIVQAVEWLQAAKRPIIVAGGGTRFCAGAVVALAERLGCAIITTVAGRGVVPGSHPLCASAQLRAAPVQELMGESDLVILLGTELAQTDHWNDDLPMPERQIRVNIDGPALIAAGDILAIKGDAGDTAERLAVMLDPDQQHGRRKSTEQRCRELRSTLADSMSEKEKRHWRVLQIVRDHLPSDARVFSDMTQLAYTAIDFMPMEQANRWHHPTGYGTLGYALPAAIGASVADPSRPVLVIVGDAGLQYTMQELPLAAELGLNINILLWNNDALQQIRDDMIAANIPPVGVVQRNPDFRLLAEACGWQYSAVDDLASLDAQMGVLFNHPGCWMLQVNENNLFSS